MFAEPGKPRWHYWSIETGNVLWGLHQQENKQLSQRANSRVNWLAGADKEAKWAKMRDGNGATEPVEISFIFSFSLPKIE